MNLCCMQVNDFVHLSDRAYTNEQILVMEKIILGKLEWTLTVPTPYVFLARFIKASIPDQEEVSILSLRVILIAVYGLKLSRGVVLFQIV